MSALLANPLIPNIPPGQDELPYDDGEPMESPKHRDQMNLLIDVLACHLADRPDVYIGGNMALYYSEIQARHNDFRAPDFFVVTHAIPDRERKSWVVWQEDGRTPDVVIELLSASTEAVDRGRKMQIYAGLRVPEYYLFDPETELLEGYRLKDNGFVPMKRHESGDYDCTALELRLGVAEGLYHNKHERWLRWKTADGALIPTSHELALVEKARADDEKARADDEKARADDEKARADDEKARADRLAERMRALGIDPEG